MRRWRRGGLFRRGCRSWCICFSYEIFVPIFAPVRNNPSAVRGRTGRGRRCGRCGRGTPRRGGVLVEGLVCGLHGGRVTGSGGLGEGARVRVVGGRLRANGGGEVPLWDWGAGITGGLPNAGPSSPLCPETGGLAGCTRGPLTAATVLIEYLRLFCPSLLSPSRVPSLFSQAASVLPPLRIAVKVRPPAGLPGTRSVCPSKQLCRPSLNAQVCSPSALMVAKSLPSGCLLVHPGRSPNRVPCRLPATRRCDTPQQ